jgi:predicted ATPase/class 3 adenylate cyclase/DNA-binding CsgD family transcriptional regulator
LDTLCIGSRRLAMHHLPTGTVTLLFTDGEESTPLLQHLGDRSTDVRTVCRHLLRRASEDYGGIVIDTQGDAFFVAFARATDAVLASIEAQRTLASQAWPEGVAVRVRMGLHTGEPHLAADGYVGLDVHRAARIMNAGHGSQILLSQTTCDLVEHALPHGASLRDLGPHRLKDLEHPHHLYQLVCEGLPAEFPPLKTLDTYPHNLPIQLTPLIGREREVAAVQHLLHRQEVRLLTLTGPGGSGKTRLGLQVAAECSDRFADGVFFVNLAPIRDPELVVSTMAQALGVKEAAGHSLLDLLSASLGEKELLLLLDNFEQVIGAAVEVATLLSRCPKLKVVVTSRAALHVRGEQEFAVPPLAVPDPKRLPDLMTLSQYEAVALFIARAQAVKPEFQVTTTNAPAVAEICVRLDGLPLAIELAAARLKLLPPPALLSRLEHRLQVLTSGAQDAPRRQQTLRNTIAWSYDLLDASEQRLFQRLSVFAGGCTIEAVWVALDPETRGTSLLDAVASLIDKNLLQQTEPDSHEPRLVMLETIGEYGLECLATSGQMETVRSAHADYYLGLAEEGEPEVYGPQQFIWLERFAREQENLRAALTWLMERTRSEMAVRLANALGWFWMESMQWSEGRTALERVLALSQGEVTLRRAMALGHLGLLLLNLGEYDRSEQCYREGLALSQELGDTQSMASCLADVALITFARGNYAAANTMYEESLEVLRKTGDRPANASWVACNWARVAIAQGEYIRARTLAEESLALAREHGYSFGIPDALNRLVEASFFQGDLAQAYALAQESLRTDESGFQKNDTLPLLGEIVLQQGESARAHNLAEESLALCEEQGYSRGTCCSLVLLGRVAAAQRNYAAARTWYEQGLQLATDRGFKWESASCLEGLASVVASQGEPAWAARLWGVAEALREAMGAPLPPVYRAEYERSVAAARAQLGQKTFAVAWAEGRTMTLDEVLAAQGQATVPMPLPTEQPSLPPATSVVTYPNGLTAREVEVLRLLAQGLTDAQIAEQLIISPRTVNTHLTSIYGKIQVSSRSAATRYAIDHTLA